MNRVPTIAISIATLALIISLYVAVRSTTTLSVNAPTTPEAGLVESIDRNSKIRVGYGVFPPYSRENPTTGAISGFSIDVANEIGRQLKTEVQWKRFNWNTMGADLKRGEYDFLADPVFLTIPRGRELTFTEPYAYVPSGIGVVRAGFYRIKQFSDLNQEGITIAVGQGFAEEDLVHARAPKATIQSINVSTDTAAPINAVITSRADVAIVNLADARRFAAANPGRLMLLWADDPPAYMPAGFALRYGDRFGRDLLNVAIQYLKFTGTLKSFADKYDLSAEISEPRSVR